MAKTLFVGHTDLDGITPLILNRFCGLDYYKEISTNYEEKGEHSDLRSLSPEDSVFYVDFTPDEEARNIIQSLGVRCTIIDHHESQYEMIENWKKEYDKVEFIYDVNKSGTLLYYEYLCDRHGLDNKVAEELCNIVSTYDLWQKTSPLWEQAQNLNRLMWKIPNWAYRNDPVKLHEFFINGQLWKLTNSDHFFFNRLEKEKINADIKQEKEMFLDLINTKGRIKTRKDKSGNYFSIFKLNKKISIICSLILEKYRKLDYVICINTYDENNPKVSVRSKEHIDILKFKDVKGHPQAGGVEGATAKFCDDLWNGTLYELERIDEENKE